MRRRTSFVHNRHWLTGLIIAKIVSTFFLLLLFTFFVLTFSNLGKCNTKLWIFRKTLLLMLPVWVSLILLPLRDEDEEGVKNECG